MRTEKWQEKRVKLYYLSTNCRYAAKAHWLRLPMQRPTTMRRTNAHLLVFRKSVVSWTA